MKKVNLIFVAMLINSIAFSQFNRTGGFFNRYGRTDQTIIWNIKAVGIGNFPSFPKAALQVNAHYLDPPTVPATMFYPGQVFRTDGPINQFNRWQLFTSDNYANAVEKFQIYTAKNLSSDNGTLQNDQNITLQATQRDMVFNAGGDGLNFERMRILGKNHDLSTNAPWFAVARAGNVGIGTAHPLCMLQIGGEASSGAGWRSWMNVGTYYASNGNYGYDNMYVGLKSINPNNPDKNDAIINWGNNPANTPNGDRLRFVFTAATSIGVTASGAEGLETGRFVTDGNVSKFGVGDFFTLTDNPKRQLDVFDDGITGINPPAIGRPQFRITQTLSTNITQGIFTDFHCTGSNNTYNPNSSGSDGHLLINTRSKETPRTVAINFEDGSTPIFGGLSLDVNGQQNIRTVNQDDAIEKVLVWDNSNEGRIMWRDASTLVGGLGDADWYDQNNIGNVPLNITDPIYTFNNVAIGADASITSRTYIFNDNEKIGLYLTSSTNNPINYGIYSEVHGGSNNETYAVYGHASNATISNTGVRGYAYGNSINIYNYGVYGEAYGNNVAQHVNYGVYGKVDGHNPQNWAGYFEGDVTITGTYVPSDIKLKENIYNITNAMEIINQLSPKTFTYKTNDYPTLNLPTILNYGLIAQEIEPILPDLVTNCIHPAEYDSIGNMVTDSIHYKVLKYEAFIPILIEGMKEQQNEIDSLENILNSYQTQFAMLDSLLQVVNNISNNYSSNSNQNNMIKNFEIVYKSYNENENTILYQNTPNPFKEITEFSYYLSNNGEVVFEIHDQYGKLIQVLANEQQSEGKHIINWDSNNLESGVYYYSLKVNGETLVKKAIKIK
jgi:flagellar hook assembly protein FlgD